MALVAAVVLTGATAAAASGWSDQLWGGAFSGWQAPPAPTSTWAAVAEQAAARAVVAVDRAPEAGPPEAGPPEASAPEAGPPEPDEPASQAEPPIKPNDSTRQPSKATVGKAMALFDQAATARARGDYDQALTLYRELQRRFPGSAEARTSRAIVARLLLDTGDAEAALADYGEYLADGGAPLTEEAMVGQARAYQRLGRTDEERAAWQALLSRFPKSMHGAHARARLQALAGAGQE
ncbi:MAG: hypothetical protein DRI90_26695 [Deltaproteobacteria bacterium]|nr:MAG: hypothetical protein DRI90_26695 [Deltaproteobacteria bacterium]